MGKRVEFLPDLEPEVEKPKGSRHPLPAGHPESWGAITRGTADDGAPYPLAVPIRGAPKKVGR